MAKKTVAKYRDTTLEWDGKPITKPGIYKNIPIEDYHRFDICGNIPSISSSGLRKIFMESPKHFFAAWDGNPKVREKAEEAPEERKHFSFGRAVHHLHLGEANFTTLFCQQPAMYPTAEEENKPWNNNAAYCRAWKAQKRKLGVTVLTSKEVDNIRGMAIEIGKHPVIRAGALNGLVERSIFWRDKETGIWLKSRPDTIPSDSGDFVDLKTTTSVIWKDLVKSLGDFAYHMQAGLGRSGAREVLKLANTSHTLVFQEKEDPWCVRVVTFKDTDLDRGEKQNEVALRTFAACLKANHWPGPGGDREDAEHIELSDYAQKAIDDRLKYELPN